MRPEVAAFHDHRTGTVSYLVSDPRSGEAAAIDPVLDYDAVSGRTSYESLDRLESAIREGGLTLRWILDTHPHADHMTGVHCLKERIGGEVAIGVGVREVTRTWREIYNLDSELPEPDQVFDRLFEDGERFSIGELAVEVLHTPGHTPACVTYVIGDAAFVGDVIFMPDFGTARCDFPGGSPQTLFQSAGRILSLPAQTRIFVGHDYGPGGRAIAWESSVAEQKSQNKHLRDGISEDIFVAMRHERDAELDLPALLLPAMQVNLRGGRLPDKEGNGTAYLKIPLNRF